MARRCGFIAEWQHQSRLQEQRRRREQAAAQRAYRDAVRSAEKAKRDAERARVAKVRTEKSERIAAERAAANLHKAEMNALAEVENTRLASVYEEIDSLLAATLEVDDYVDLNSLRKVAKHPEFSPGAIGRPTPEAPLVPIPPEPRPRVLDEPGFFSRLFSKGKIEAAKQRAHQDWVSEHQAWMHHVQVEIPKENARLVAERDMAERRRIQELEKLRVQYDEECSAREMDVARHNEAITSLIEGLSEFDEDAINEYVGIVLANSVYPPTFEVEHEYEFDADLKELSLSVSVPSPDTIPTTKHVRYVASADELRPTALSQKDQRLRYNSAVYSVALRTLHEVFEADREGRIEFISLELGTEAVSPATGKNTEITYVLAAAERESFVELNLAGVEPLAALQGLNAAVSKNPFGLVGIPNTGSRVRL